MIVAKASPCLARVYLAGDTAEARLNVSALLRLDLVTRADVAYSLTAGKLDKRMSSHQVVIDDSLQSQLTDRSRKTHSPVAVEAIHEIVHQLHLETPESKDRLV